MDKQEAQLGIKKLQSEASSLQASSLITLWELDLGDLANDRGIVFNNNDPIFRFHNNLKLVTNDIIFQGNKYQICPLEAEGFEINSKGTLPTPILRISTVDEGVPLLAALKDQIRSFGDIIGCKVTRRRTFAKFLKLSNFNVDNALYGHPYDGDDLIEFPPDIYFINRKTKENKLIIEYELASIMDLEGIVLPRRTIISKRCNFTYRGEGCNYEYSSRKNDDIHGESTILPSQAIPVATDEDKIITEVLGISSITDLGAYVTGNTYFKGQSVYIQHGGIKYYFVSKRDNVNSSPYNTNDWIADKCSKCIKGCKIRWGKTNPEGSVDVKNTPLVKGELPFGGFPSTERLRGNSY